MERGITDVGRTITRDPSHLAQTLLSHVRGAGEHGLALARLAQILPAFGAGEIDRAIGELWNRGSIRKELRSGAVYLVEAEER